MKTQPKILGLPQNELNPRDFGGMCSRSIKLEDGSEPLKGIQTIATTSDPALVLDWSRWEIVREVLPMRYVELPEPNKLPLLDAHSRWSIEDVKGSAKGFRVEGNALMCETFVSASEEDIITKIKEKHIDSVSIGYETDHNQTVEVPTNKAVTVDGIAYTNDFTDGYPMLIRTWWKPKELSMVPIGADERAKFKAMNGINAEGLVEQINILKKEIEAIKTESKTLPASVGVTEQKTEPEIKTEPATEQKAEVKTERKETVLKVNKAEYEKYKTERLTRLARLAVEKEIAYQKGLVS